MRSRMERPEEKDTPPRRSPPNPPSRPGRNNSPAATEKGTASFPVRRGTEGLSPSKSQFFYRPTRNDTSPSKPLQQPQRMTPKDGGATVDEVGATGIIAIGMALGNPAADHEIVSTLEHPQVMGTISTATSNEAEEQLPRDEMSRTKSRKWVLFSRSKSHRVRATDRSHVPPSPPLDPTVAGTNSNGRGSSETLSGSLGATAPLPSRQPLERCLTAPSSSKSQRLRDSNARNDSFRSSTRDETAQSVPSVSTETTSQQPFLTVDIPDVKLERYSVMFAGLLERQRITPEKLGALTEGDEDDTSRPDKPAIRQKSSTDGASPIKPPSRPDPVQTSSRTRSNTSPAVPTPSREAFAGVDQQNSEHLAASHIVGLASNKGRIPKPPQAIHKNDDGRPSLRSKFHSRALKKNFSVSPSKFNLGGVADECAGQQGSPPSLFRHKGQIASTGTRNASLPKDRGFKSTNYTHTIHADTSSTLSKGSLSEEEEEMGEVDSEVVQEAIRVAIVRPVTPKDQRHMLGPLRMHPVNGRVMGAMRSTPRLIETKKDALSPLMKC